MNGDFIYPDYISYNVAGNKLNQTDINDTTIYSTLSDKDVCIVESISLYNTSFGIVTAVPEWEALTTIVILAAVILGTIFGNILVILGVFTYKPLRIVQNFFIVSLAVADLAVAILVMPLNVAYSTFGLWLWGKHLCKLWLTSDIMCCTSSILNLCAIALDRYWAITDPINYANKRTLKRVMFQIGGVWILSLIISSPPLLGWNDWPDEFTGDTPCQLTSEPGYVIYSSFGSFFIPLLIMTIVYIKIFLAARQRLRRRTLAHRLCKKKSEVQVKTLEKDNQEVNNREESENDNDSESSQSIKRAQKRAFMDIKKNLFFPLLLLNDPIARQQIEANVGEIQRDVSPSGYGKKVIDSIRKVSQKRRKQGKPLLISVTNQGNVVHQFIEEKQKISLSKERRAARTLGIIMGSFVVCWLPFFLMYMFLPFCPWCCPSNKVINFITWLGYVNSTLNPIIYTVFNLDFRRAFKKLLGFSG